MASRCVIFVLLALLVALSSPARADVGDVFGFGSRMAGVAGAGSAAWGYDAYGAYANPASVAVRYSSKKLLLSWGLIYMQPSFKPINDVVVENDYTSDKTTPRLGSVDVDYRPTFGQALGASLPLKPDFMNLSLGLTAFLPLDSLAFMDTGEPFVPEYFQYRSRTQRPQINLALGAKPLDHLHFGVGANLAFSLTSNGFVFLQTDSTKTSSMRFTSSIKPKIVPYFGLLYTSSNEDRESPLTEAYEPGDLTLGLVVRTVGNYTNTIDLHSGARAFGDFAALDFAFQAQSALYYDPASFELGASYQLTHAIRVLGGAKYQLWSSYVAPALDIQQPTIENCTDNGAGSCDTPAPIQISSSSNPVFSFRNIIVPSAGAEIGLGTKKLRVGYAYRPSILGALPTGKGNYIDPGRHEIAAGLGLPLSNFLGVGAPYNLDLHASVQFLETQHIVKTAGDENGTVGQDKIGAPGYDAGGLVYGGGLSLSLAF